MSTVLNSMLKELIDNNKEDHRLSKHIMKCYSRLSENMQYNVSNAGLVRS